MTKIFKWISNLFNKSSFIKDIPGDYNEYDFVLNTAFIEPSLIIAIHRDVILLTINNDFYVDPALLMTHFRRHYNFTINEFMVLSFKVGSTTKFYLENPISLLKDAIELTDDFTPEGIKRLKYLLEQQVALKEQGFNEEHEDYLIKLKDDKKEAKLRVKGIENDKADKQIDAWLQNNKKD